MGTSGYKGALDGFLYHGEAANYHPNQKHDRFVTDVHQNQRSPS